jgi:hypothetical protein
MACPCKFRTCKHKGATITEVMRDGTLISIISTAWRIKRVPPDIAKLPRTHPLRQDYMDELLEKDRA